MTCVKPSHDYDIRDASGSCVTGLEYMLSSEAKCLRRDSYVVVNTFSRCVQFYNILSVLYFVVAST